MTEAETVESFEGMIRHIVAEMRIIEEHRDLAIQTGRIAVLYAIRHYNPSRGALSTLAYHYVRGHLMHMLRDECGSILHGSYRDKQAGRVPYAISFESDTTLKDESGEDSELKHEIPVWDDLTEWQVTKDVETATRKITTIPDKVRRIVMERVAGRDFADIADDMGISKFAALQCISRFRPFLRRELSEYDPERGK